MTTDRRSFLADVGTGLVTATVGSALVADLGLGRALAADEPARLTFGRLEPLVALLQDTPPARLQPLLVARLRDGLELKQLVAAGALANARTFGGEDYVGFHTLMALGPAFAMSAELPAAKKALPVLKVLYRNSTRCGEKGGHKGEVLRPVAPATLPAGRPGADALRAAVHARDVGRAEGTLATLSRGAANAAFNDLLQTVEEATEVHRIVLAYRAWDMVNVLGTEHAHTMLRQSVRYCIRSEAGRAYWAGRDEVQALLPRLLERHRLLTKPEGRRAADDAWVERLSQTFFKSTPAQAAEAAALALAEGIQPDAVGEAIALAANQLVLRDPGRPAAWASPGKPAGSTHGDSIGVHACDSANAWRGCARAANHRNRMACLILGAYQVALDRSHRQADILATPPYPREEQLKKLSGKEPAALLREAEGAIRDKDQARAAAAVHRLGELRQPAAPVLALLLRYAISEDGALHAEKYYRTATEEFATGRAAFRWRQLVALARVTASAYGLPAPGHAEACRLLEA